jgi:hypothetical protein
MAKRSKHSISGQTLLEAIMGLAVLGVVIVTLAQFSNSSLNVAKTRRLNTTRNQLISDLVKLASSPAALRASAAMGTASSSSNQDLASCIGGSSSSCDSLTQSDFVLYGPSTNTGVAPGALTGTSAQPLRYRGDGIPCAGTSCPATIYPIEVYTQFRPVCAPPGPTAPGQPMLSTLTPPLTCDITGLDVVLVTITVESTPGATQIVPGYQTTVPVRAKIIPNYNWL